MHAITLKLRSPSELEPVRVRLYVKLSSDSDPSDSDPSDPSDPSDSSQIIVRLYVKQ